MSEFTQVSEIIFKTVSERWKSLRWPSFVETELFVFHKAPFNCSLIPCFFSKSYRFLNLYFSCIAFCFFSFTVLKHFLKFHTIFKEILNWSNRKLSVFYSILFYSYLFWYVYHFRLLLTILKKCKDGIFLYRFVFTQLNKSDVAVLIIF